MPIDYDTEKRHLERKLTRLKDCDYIPDSMLDLLTKVAQRQLDARLEARVEIPAGHELPAEHKHILGQPLLPASDFIYDEEQYESLFNEFLHYMQEIGGHLGVAATAISKDVKAGNLDLGEAASRFLAADHKYFQDYAAKTPDAPSTLSFLVQASLSPSFEALGKRLNKKRDQDRIWDHGSCPVCGSLPLIGRLKEKEGARHLTCAFCHTEYRVHRISCPFCGEREQPKLLFFESPEGPGYRVDTCKSCKMYIKTADFRELDRISLPLFDDLESLAMDILAREEGYTRPTLSGWGF